MCWDKNYSSTLENVRASPPQGPILGRDAKSGGWALLRAPLEGHQQENWGRAHQIELRALQLEGPGWFLTEPQFPSFKSIMICFVLAAPNISLIS
jgi:hypothetical protein